MPASKSERVQIVISKAEVERLDAWRGPRQIWSRSDAIRRLIAEGIDRDEQQQAQPAQPEAAEPSPVSQPAAAAGAESGPTAGAAKKPAKPRRGAKAGSAAEVASGKPVEKPIKGTRK